MILTGSEIEFQVKCGNITIDPFDSSCINPNSYNFRLGSKLLVYEDEIIDTRFPSLTKEILIPEAGFVLKPYQLYLAHTIEQLGSPVFAPTYAARSSIARLGLFINLSAPLGDIGFVGQWTLQLFALNHIRVYTDMRIGQMMFWSSKGEINLYSGKYQGSIGPNASQIFKDVKCIDDKKSGDERN